MPLPLNCFLIAEATVSIFPVDAEGEVDISDPVFEGKQAESIRIAESFEEIEDRPTGDRYPTFRHGAQLHAIEIGKLWELSLDDTSTPPPEITLDAGASSPARDHVLLRDQEYVLCIVWQDEERPGSWHARTYFGVFDRSREIGAESFDE
ncbi:MAG TPA: hypothetical protein VNU68_07590, partial [Verrucomicrobiae bacterium]|nr:hypothetical protein [Verrucomicrobiae bacterium]